MPRISGSTLGTGRDVARREPSRSALAPPASIRGGAGTREVPAPSERRDRSPAPSPAPRPRTPLARVRRRTDVLVLAGATLTAALLVVPVLVAVVAALVLWWARRRRGGSAVTTVEAGATCLAGALALAAATSTSVLVAPVEEPLRLVTAVAVLAGALVAGRLVVRLVRGPVRVVRLVAPRPASRPTRPEVGSTRHLEVVATVGVAAARSGEAAPALADALVGRPEELAAVVSDLGADAVVLAPGTLAEADVAALGRALGALEVPLVVVLDGVLEGRVSVGSSPAAYGRTLVTVAPHGASATLRRVAGLLDRTVAALLLLAALPLLALLALWVRVDSPGPALFRQERVGRAGRLFTIHKLRTMHVDADRRLPALVVDNEADGALFKIRADPRVTRAGRWLRRSSLDELPQLWDVVRGEMSLVGPRPALPHEVEAYDAVARHRLSVKPGITGPWQVNGRSDLPWSTAVELDVAYADNHSIAGDLVICVQTVSAVVRAKGAY